MSVVLLAAGIYNILWAGQALLWPNWLFQWADVPLPAYPEIWQGWGLLIGVLGIGYLSAWAHPMRYWPLVLTGLLGRIFAAIGCLIVGLDHRLPWAFCGVLALNDLIWWIPLGVILWSVYRTYEDGRRYASPEIQQLALRTRTNQGHTLFELSTEKPLLIVFLRTIDCPFCREALTALAQARSGVESRDAQLVLVHMGQEPAMQEFLERYRLSDLPRVSDDELHLYRAFGLRRGSVGSVLGPGVWVRGASRWMRYGAGKLTPDLLQMPGVFLVFHGQVLWNFVHRSIADQPRYEDVPIPP